MFGGRKSTTRRLLEEDYDSFFESTERRTGPRNRDQIIAALEAKNSYRMWRIRHDLKWLKRELKKMGLSPEDFRELL